MEEQIRNMAEKNEEKVCCLYEYVWTECQQIRKKKEVKKREKTLLYVKAK
jgi:hypothetical protein